MSTNFPNGLDNFPNPNPTTLLSDPVIRHSLLHTRVNSAIRALEEKVGVNFSNVNISIDYICQLLMLWAGVHNLSLYFEFEYDKVIPIKLDSIIWYTDDTKTTILMRRDFLRNTMLQVVQEDFYLFDPSTGNIVRHIRDSIQYDPNNPVLVLNVRRTVFI